MNIRNNVAHGWLGADAFEDLLSARLVHVALVIWCWSLDEVAATPEGAPSLPL